MSERRESQSHDNTPAEWDARYAEAAQSGRMWSGNPNALLVHEAATLTPGAALDVGCGEGADAVWLAGRGWAVTAVDVSGVAVARGRAAAEAAGVEVDWRVQDVAEVGGAYDLVSAFYPVLRKDSGALDQVLSLVAPGGTLLFVHHLDTDRDRALEHGFDPDDYVGPADVAAALGDGWQIERHHAVERAITSGAGAHHHRDGIVRAVRVW